MKRNSVYSTLIGSLAGAAPPAGWDTAQLPVNSTWER